MDATTTQRPTLTFRQQQVLDFIAQYMSLNGYAPTLRDIGAHMRISSTNAVNDHLLALVKKGYLKRTTGFGLRQAIQIISEPDTLARLVEYVRQLGAELGEDLGPVGAPLPEDWLDRCKRAARVRATG